MNPIRNIQLLVIPDIHGRHFWRDAAKGHEEERIIFLGDYLDPYPWDGVTYGEATKTLKDVIALKKSHPESVTLLLGNHDLGYLDSKICCSRMDRYGREINRSIILDNIDLFDIVCVETIAGREHLFSHAGIRETWIRQNPDLLDAENFHPNNLNALLHDSARRSDLFRSLRQVSAYRGGLDDASSPVWADICEFADVKDGLSGYRQIVGHTFHEGDAINVDDSIWCLDCAKAFRIGENGEIYSEIISPCLNAERVH